MDDTPAPQVRAAGDRSVAAQVITGPVATGDHAAIDARTVALAAGAIPRPDQVSITTPVHNLPRPAARVFEGREAALGLLAGALASVGSAVVTQAIYGLGGVGKSELALHHAHGHRDDYQLMWWITAADANQVQAGLAALAARLCPEIAVAGTTADTGGWAVGWLQAHDRWLLVLDNVDDPGDVQPLLGQLTSGHIVLTTRRDVDWQQLAVPVWLEVLDPGPAAAVITARTGQATPDDRQAAAVAAELGYLPLALDQAAAYITQTRLTPGGYLAKLRQHPARTYAARGAGDAQRTVALLWDITIEAIRGQDPGAVRLLWVLAHYAPDSIPRIIVGGADPGEDIDAQLSLLASYSMITLTPQAISLHRLVQAVILSQQPNTTGDAPDPATTALDWLNQAIPDHPGNNVAGWPLLRALVPHVDHLTTCYPPSGDQPEQLGRVHNEFGMFHQAQGDYQRALALRESALRICQAKLGPDHPNMAVALGNLADTYRALGRAAEALPLLERALRIIEAALGPDHPDVAVALGNLAGTYRALGRAAEALPLFERALRITEAALGPDHPDVAVALGNRGSAYRDLGRAAEALPLFERALRITEAALGPDHPNMAVALGNLAGAYRALGRAAEALPLDQRAAQIAEAKFNVQANQLAFDRLRNQDPAAAELAAICAFLAPEPIPADWFPRAAKALPPPLDSKAADPLAWRQVLGRVAQQALARLDQHGLVMHRLTQAIVRGYLPPEVATGIREAAAALLAANHPGGKALPSTWPGWALMLPHLLALGPETSTAARSFGVPLKAWTL